MKPTLDLSPNRSLRRFIGIFIFCFLYQIIWGNDLQAENINCVTPTGTLYGTLELPEAVKIGQIPVTLIIAGSGPTNRDGNSNLIPGKNDSLKMMAEELSKRGIASVRYDKRGVGASFKAGYPENDLRIDVYISDAKYWIHKLYNDKRFNAFFIVGHSEGALIGYVIAQNAKVNGVISIAGCGRSADIVIYEQLASACAQAYCPPGYLKDIRKILKRISDGEIVEKIPFELLSIFRPSVQPYLQSWFRYDPAEEIKKVSAPVLIIQGTSDLQTSIEDSQRLLEANPKNKLFLIQGMNHLLKIVPKERQMQTYSYKDHIIPIAPQLIKHMALFINEEK